jgi:hypothetical protein
VEFVGRWVGRSVDHFVGGSMGQLVAWSVGWLAGWVFSKYSRNFTDVNTSNFVKIFSSVSHFRKILGRRSHSM